MKNRFKFRCVLKKKEDFLSKPFLKNNIFDVISLGFNDNGVQTVTLLGFHENGDYSIYEADAEDVELIQCTGLTDMNDRLIWEGDIVQQKYSPRKIGVVKFDYYWKDFDVTNMSKFSLVNRAEVIGNIYDNPELIRTNENG